MTPLEIIRGAQAAPLCEEDGEPVPLRLLPGLTGPELQAFAATLPCPLPPHVEELLRHCRGLDGALDVVDFTGGLEFEHEDVFPHGLPVAGDGFGNFWVVDLHSHATDLGPIYFACHDAPVILCQAATLAEFLAELFRMYRPPHKSLVDDVHEDRLAKVWRSNPGVLTYEECLASADPVLAGFAAQLDASFQIIDLRTARPGDGFSWGRYGPRTVIKRCGALPVFAYQKREGILRRLFRR